MGGKGSVPGRCFATFSVSPYSTALFRSLAHSHLHSPVPFRSVPLTAAPLLVCLFCVPCFIVYGIVVVAVAWCVVFTFVIVGLVFPSSAKADADCVDTNTHEHTYIRMYVCIHIYIHTHVFVVRIERRCHRLLQLFNSLLC